MHDIVVACVGKPSAGKSSFLNAVTDAQAKIGNYPFTTIEPNYGVTFYPVDCPCKLYQKTEFCRPRHGKCENGTRYVPIKIMDVAGLIPGASEGLGLGNKFLDDLRHADVLIHVVDVSGTTNEKGETTVGYDPTNDIEWLRTEIHSWIYRNLKSKWGTIVRRHVATKSTDIDTMQAMLSGYGANRKLVGRFLSKIQVSKSLPEWDVFLDLPSIVDVFLEERFPTVLVLNKIDHQDADKNIAKICQKYDESKIALTSALAELFLKKLQKGNFIKYEERTDNVETIEDLTEEEAEKLQLKPLDSKTKNRLEKIKDLVLFRYGSTGVIDGIILAVNTLGMIPVFPVRNINTFSSDTGSRNKGCFRDCGLVRPGTTVRELANLLNIGKYYLGAETVGSRQLGEDDPITLENNIISFKLSMNEESED